MISHLYKKLISENIIQTQINILFVSFIFLFGFKFENIQFRFLILILLLPCVKNIFRGLSRKNFKEIINLLIFLVLIISHSFLNIFYEGANLTKYNIYGIVFLFSLFTISYYFHENFNENITKIIKIFLLFFFTSVIISLYNFKNDAPFFCGGIPYVFEILKPYSEFLPTNIFNILNEVGPDRIADIKFSFKEYLFQENSHLGMIAPSLIIYSLYLITEKNEKITFIFVIVLFIILTLIKGSTTLLTGTVLSLVILIIFNFKNFTKKTLIIFTLIIFIFSTILIFSKECRSRFVPTYASINILDNTKEKETIITSNSKVAQSIKNILGVGGNLSSRIYFHALKIAKKSILEKPFGWGINRYNVAFNYYNEKNPSKVEQINFYNDKDGTNNFVKLTVEFGVLAFFLYFFFLLFLTNKKIPIELKLFYIPFVITQSLRGAGYFNGGFSLVIFLMLFTYLKLNKKIY